MVSNKSSWTVRCQACEHSWKRIGHWSHFEREAIEAKPCPNCGAYALSSPEPQSADLRPHRTRQPSPPNRRVG